MSDEKQQTELARFYTRSRKFPRLIGRLHDGTKIPGGPYTVTQAIVAAVLLALGLVTRGVWGTGTILVDIPIVVLLAWGGAWGAGRLPPTRRNVGSVLLGAAGAVLRPAAGKYRDQSVRLRPPHYAAGVTIISRHIAAPVITPPPLATPATTAPTTPVDRAPDAAPPVPAEALATRAPVTGVERLLAQAHGSRKD